MNHDGMIGTEGIDTCGDCLAYLSRIGPGAKRECYDCYYATETGQPNTNDPAQPPEQVVVHRMSSMSAQEHEMLEQMSRRVDNLSQKLTEREGKRKPSKYQQYKVDKPAK